jgi:hypothetical protein
MQLAGHCRYTVQRMAGSIRRSFLPDIARINPSQLKK